MDLLIVGGGGREHALAWKLRQSPGVDRLLAAPGNAGVAECAECIPIPPEDLDGLVRLACERRVGLVVVGPEAPLAAGLADRLRAAGIPVFGPTARAARIESSKVYARELGARMGIPQPRYARFTDFESAAAHLDRLAAEGVDSVVVKADGLAAGKGAVVCDDLEAARRAARAMLTERAFGEAGREILIEERLAGQEVSLFVLTDGHTAVPLLPARDYKRALDGDRGPNTGGMGSYAPAPLLPPERCREVLERIVLPALHGLATDGAPFRGCLYAGLMLTASGPKLIEFNCRFGDPETQAVLPLLETDLFELLHAAATGSLEGRTAHWRPGCAVCVVLASGGYPGAYETGYPIEGLAEAAALPDVLLFHAGTARRDGRIVTAGGRVLGVTGLGATFAAARERAYAAAARIAFARCHLRRDIAAGVLEPV